MCKSFAGWLSRNWVQIRPQNLCLVLNHVCLYNRYRLCHFLELFVAGVGRPVLTTWCSSVTSSATCPLCIAATSLDYWGLILWNLEWKLIRFDRMMLEWNYCAAMHLIRFFVILVFKLLLSCLNSMVIIAQVSFCWPTVRLQSSGLLWNIWGQLWQESASIRFPFFLMPIQCKEYLMIYEPLCCIAFHVVLLCLLCLLVC